MDAIWVAIIGALALLTNGYWQDRGARKREGDIRSEERHRSERELARIQSERERDRVHEVELAREDLASRRGDIWRHDLLKAHREFRTTAQQIRRRLSYVIGEAYDARPLGGSIAGYVFPDEAREGLWTGLAEISLLGEWSAAGKAAEVIDIALATHRLLLDIEAEPDAGTDLVASLQEPCRELDEALRHYLQAARADLGVQHLPPPPR